MLVPKEGEGDLLATVDGFAMKLALGKAATLALDGREVLPGRLLESGFQYQFSQLPQALDDLLD